MLNPDLKLDKRIFTDKIEELPTRNGYGEGLVVAGENNPSVVALSADLTESTRTDAFAKRFPERFVEMGVAEQNMATVASGLAVSGKMPFISSYATFSPGRNWEQIRTTIAYNKANVKIAGHHAGISVGPDGATHQAIEDIATMRAIPGMKVIVPCDAIEARKATIAASQIFGPVYLRFAREKTPVMTTSDTPFFAGKTQIFWEGKKPAAAIVAAGPLLYQALLAAAALEKEKISVIVANCHTIKPLDEKMMEDLARRTGAIVTVEEHTIMGGLGGAVSEAVARHCPVPMEFVGMQDTFGESGDPIELMVKYGLDAPHIVRAVKKAIRRK